MTVKTFFKALISNIFGDFISEILLEVKNKTKTKKQRGRYDVLMKRKRVKAGL